MVRKNHALRNAAAGGGEAEVAELLDGGIRAKSAVGSSALHAAVKGGHDDVVALLLSRGARVDARDAAGWTPLHHASHVGHAGVVEALLRAGADAGATTPEGLTPLHVASREGRADAISVLLSWGADGEATDGDGNTPLDLAVSGGHSDAAYMLDPAKDLTVTVVPAEAAPAEAAPPARYEIDGPFGPAVLTGESHPRAVHAIETFGGKKASSSTPLTGPTLHEWTSGELKGSMLVVLVAATWILWPRAGGGRGKAPAHNRDARLSLRARPNAGMV